MKKIKSIRHLQNEKKRMKEDLNALENKIRRNWKELKESLKPATVARNSINQILSVKTKENITGDSILKNTFIYGVSLLAKKFAGKAVGKFVKTPDQ